MVDEDEGLTDISMTAKEVAKIEKKKAEKALANPSSTYAIACPDCGCDYLIPLYGLHFTKSFAGNRMLVTWPSREGNDDTALVVCPICQDIIRISSDGEISKTGTKWGKKKK